MFRTARRITPLLRTLLLGALSASAVTMAGGVVVGCADENDPETHVGKLKDPATRPAAVKRLIQFFEDAMTRDNKDREGKTVKPLLDKIIVPLTEQCVSGDLDERTNANLIKFLSDARDARTEPCMVKVLKEYKVDGNEEDIRWVSRAVGATKMKAAGGPLLEVFIKLRPSKPKASAIYQDVSDALEALLDPAWEDQLVKLLERPINDRKDGAVLKDEVYWQATSAKLLGILKSQKATKPLIKAVLSPMKADIAPTAVNALIKIGKPAIAPAIAVLKSEDKDLVEYSTLENMKAAQGPDGKTPDSAKKSAATAHVGAAAIILATIGREEAAGPMIEQLAKADDLSRAVIARELAKLPQTEQTMKAFQDAYEKTPVTLSIPPGLGARESMLEAAGTFFDASLVPWIVQTAQQAKGEDADVEPVRAASLATAMKLMKADQVSIVDGLYGMKATGADGKATTLGKGYEKEYKIAKELLTACGDKVECYLAKLAEPASQAKETQFQGIKSAYMVGVLGGPEIRQKLIELMPKLSNAAVRFVSVSVIDASSPKGDAAIAASLQKIVDAGEASKNPETMSGNAPFKTIIYRLNARAQ